MQVKREDVSFNSLAQAGCGVRLAYNAVSAAQVCPLTLSPLGTPHFCVPPSVSRRWLPLQQAL
jgi:hypothetical protein